jgi:hypothetical protein
MLCFLLVGRKREEKKERETARGLFFPGPDMPFWLCCMGFSQLLVTIKG